MFAFVLLDLVFSTKPKVGSEERLRSDLFYVSQSTLSLLVMLIT